MKYAFNIFNSFKYKIFYFVRDRIFKFIIDKITKFAKHKIVTYFKQNKIKFYIITYLLVLTTFLVSYMYFFPVAPFYKNNIRSIIIFFAIFYVFLSVLIFSDKFRKKIFNIFLLNLVSWKLYTKYFISVFLTIFFLSYYNLSSQVSDNILPESFKFNVIQISAILGGLVLIASSIKTNRIKNVERKKLLLVACELISATILLILFNVASYWAFKDGNPIPFSFDLTTVGNILLGIAYITSIFSFYLGHPLFLMGLFDLLLIIYQLIRKYNR